MEIRHPRVTIYGQPPSKSNSYKIITVGGHPRLGKTKATREYEERFYMQCAMRGAGISRRFRIDIDVYFGSDRPDLDNAQKVILDCLQACGVIKNDRLCVELHARKLVDKVRPRVEFEIEELL